jgi:filamentous hemagglutinin
MVSSQISTASGKDSVYIVAKDTIDVGRSTLNSNVAGKGIVTARGGGINIYTGKDLNVNQSRIMTFFGGDITLWADSGNINAGRGSKTAVSPPTFTQIKDFAGNITGYKVNPPAVGSGLRALTYDANTRPDGDIPIPKPGNIYAFAPNGAIDAGEAGIAGGKIVLGATEVLNAKNISFSVGSVGVPSANEASVSIGALAGTGNVTDTGKMVGEASALGGTKDKLTQQTTMVDDFLSKFLDVRVISFDSDSDEIGKDKKDKEK